MQGAREAFGVPAIVLGASFLGFGALVREAGLSPWHGLLSTALGWALPGQVAMVELYAAGASLVAILAAVAVTNARLLPMTVSLMPLLRAPGRGRGALYLAAYFVAVTGWAAAMRQAPLLPAPARLPYFLGFVLVICSSSLVATAGGYYLAAAVPPEITLGLVFLNPIYFMLVFAADARRRARVLAQVLGALAGPALYLVATDWSLLLTGLLAGSLAFFGDRWWRRRAEGPGDRRG